MIKNLKWLIGIPLVLACSIFYFTRHEQKVFASESIIYTGIASGYDLNGSTKADYFATSNAFDNLLSIIDSRETKQDVLIALLAEHLSLKKHDPEILTWSAYDELSKLIPDEARKNLVKPTIAETRLAINNLLKKDDENVIYQLINSDNHYYSLDALKKIQSSRLSNSDLIKITYEANDPYICKRTLELLEESFMLKHKMLKEGQTGSVVNYFAAETKRAFSRLDSSEKIFLDFNRNNEIINYYEQTKAVAGEREDLYAMNHNLEMDKMASSKSLAKVNENIKNRAYQSVIGNEILAEREKLTDVYNKIALGEIVNKGSTNKSQIDSLKSSATKLEKKLQSSLDNLYVESNTPNGIPTKNVLDEWLKTTLAFEQSKARLAVMDQRKKEFEEEYRRFAPLGAMLKKIERQISVSEQEYLELLHGLNLAKLTQQNTELTSKLNVVDPPFLPVKAIPSKRKLLIALGFIGGFILVLALILTKALINKTLLEPSRAKKIIGIPMLGLYPLLEGNEEFLEKANRRLIQQFLSRITSHGKPVTIGLISIQKREGKSTIGYLLTKELTDLNYRVNTQMYDSRRGIRPVTDDVDFTLVEFPSLDDIVIKPDFFPAVNYTFLLCRANRIWNKIDKEILEIFSKTTGQEPMFILNGVDPHFAEEYIGEVPKKRDKIRAFLKKLFNFEFGNRKAIKVRTQPPKKNLIDNKIRVNLGVSKRSRTFSLILGGLALSAIGFFAYTKVNWANVIKSLDKQDSVAVISPVKSVQPKFTDNEFTTSEKNTENTIQKQPPSEEKPFDVASASETLPEKVFFVIVGSFGKQENAQVLLDELNTQGFSEAKIISPKSGEKLIKVAAAVFESDAKATQEALAISAKLNKSAWIYHEKQPSRL